MLNEMPELRAPENSRIGIEIKPKVRYPDQTEAAIVNPTHLLLERARAHRVASLVQLLYFYAPDFVQLPKIKAGYLGVPPRQHQGIVFTHLGHGRANWRDSAMEELPVYNELLS